MDELRYEVVHTPKLFDIGLATEWNKDGTPKRVLCRYSVFSLDPGQGEYGGVDYVSWIRTGIYLTREEWNKLTYKKSTEEIADILGIGKVKPVAKEKVQEFKDDYIVIKLSDAYKHLDSSEYRTLAGLFHKIKEGRASLGLNPVCNYENDSPER